MVYKILGPYTYQEYCAKGLEDKIANLADTVKILTNLCHYFCVKGEDYKEGFCLEDGSPINYPISVSRVAQNAVGGFVLTSTKSRCIPNQGIEIDNKRYPFDLPKLVYWHAKTRKTLRTHQLIEGVFSTKDLARLLRTGSLDFCMDSCGEDCGGDWLSRCTLDICISDPGIISFSYDSPLERNFKYIAFLEEK